MPARDHVGHWGDESAEAALPGRRLSALAEQAARCTADCCGASSTVAEAGADRPAAALPHAPQRRDADPLAGCSSAFASAVRARLGTASRPCLLG